MNSDKESRLVYSTDPALNKKCPRCKELISECSCEKGAAPLSHIKAVLRIEKSGRGGKVVTVVDGLPSSENYLKEMASFLKGRLGSGGSYGKGERGGFVEIQGDKRDLIRPLLMKKGIQVKG